MAPFSEKLIEIEGPEGLCFNHPGAVESRSTARGSRVPVAARQGNDNLLLSVNQEVL